MGMGESRAGFPVRRPGRGSEGSEERREGEAGRRARRTEGVGCGQMLDPGRNEGCGQREGGMGQRKREWAKEQNRKTKREKESDRESERAGEQGAPKVSELGVGRLGVDTNR